MVTKKTTKKKTVTKKSIPKKKVTTKKIPVKKNSPPSIKNIPTLQMKGEYDIALDFATKVYKKFGNPIKSIILFGSSAKKAQTAGSDIDIIILIDDVTIVWDQELTAWYREELNKILSTNPYNLSLHINTIKLSTWWQDLMRGDPVLLNIVRYGQALVDIAGFFEPIKHLLLKGKIKATPEAIHACLQRAPQHFTRSRIAELSSIEGLFWSMVDSAHAALIAAKALPASPEHIPAELKMAFVDKGKLKSKYVSWYRELLDLHKQIEHGQITDLQGVVIDDWQARTQEFMKVMVNLVDQLIS